MYVPLDNVSSQRCHYSALGTSRLVPLRIYIAGMVVKALVRDGGLKIGKKTMYACRVWGDRSCPCGNRDRVISFAQLGRGDPKALG